MSFAVFKQGDGYRWRAISSNAYQDREGEILARQGLDEDCNRADATGDYGPLRYWHLFVTKEGKLSDNPKGISIAELRNGVDLGDCDFNCMVGNLLFESGTFRSKSIGEYFLEHADEYSLSLGFLPTTEPGPDGVIWHLYRIERSVIPNDMGLAANPFTALAVGE